MRKLQHETNPSIDKGKQDARSPLRARLTTVLAAAGAMLVSPMAESIARAQDGNSTEPPPAAAPAEPASAEAPAAGSGRRIIIDDVSVGGESGESSGETPAKPTGEPAGKAPFDADKASHEAAAATATETPAPAGPDLRDHSLSYYGDEVGMAGNERTFMQRNRLNLGGHFFSNEAGESIWGSARFTLRSNGHKPLTIEGDAGNIWFGRLQAPFLRAFVHPEVNVWRFKGAYYGTASGVYGLPSWLYTSHAAGIGFSQPIGDNSRLRLGFIGGGSLSYPAFDDIFFQMAGGASFEYKDFLVYGMVNSFFAAPTPTKTAFIGYYSPRFQNTEFGVQYKFGREKDDKYAVRLFGDYGTINQRVGARVSRSMRLGDELAGDFWIGGGATHWAEEVGARWDPSVIAGIRLSFGGKHFDSTNTAEFEHYTLGGVESVQTDIATSENPGPYGFGRSGDPVVDGQINQAKERIAGSRNFAQFAESYRNASTNDKIMAARFIGAFFQQVAYANGAAGALYSTDFLNPEVQRIAGASTDTVFSYLQRYVEFYETHAPGTPLPDDLAKGIVICAGSADTQAQFLRANGIPTTVLSVNTRSGPHVIAAARPPGSTALLDYGNLYTAPENSFDEALRYYGWMRQAPTFRSQLFNQDGYLGTYETAEGRMFQRVVGLRLMQILGRDFLGVP
jgi:hypothetical protein